MRLVRHHHEGVHTPRLLKGQYIIAGVSGVAGGGGGGGGARGARAPPLAPGSVYIYVELTFRNI